MDKRLKAAEARAEAAEGAARRAAADTQALAAQVAELRAAASANQHAPSHAQVRIRAPHTHAFTLPCDCAADARSSAARAGRGTGWRCARSVELEPVLRQRAAFRAAGASGARGCTAVLQRDALRRRPVVRRAASCATHGWPSGRRLHARTGGGS